MKNLTFYILVPTVDFPSMGRGKSVAHAAHAANQFTYVHMVKPLLDNKLPMYLNSDVVAWHNQARGFGTTIALDIGDINNMVNVVNSAKLLGGLSGVIVDPTYPYLVDNEIAKLIDLSIHTQDAIKINKDQMICFRQAQTCGYVFGDKDSLNPLLSKYKLLPND